MNSRRRVNSIVRWFLTMPTDATIIAAIIGAVGAVIAALLALLPQFTKKRHNRENSVQEELREPNDKTRPVARAHEKFDVSLFVILGNGRLGPIKTTLYGHHKPEILVAQSMNDPLAIPATMRTAAPRHLFWREGKRFLDASKTYAQQRVHAGDTLVLTDISDSEMMLLLIDVLGAETND